MLERLTVTLVPDRASFRRVESLIQGIGGTVDLDTSRAERELRDLGENRDVRIDAALTGDSEIRSTLNDLDDNREIRIGAELVGVGSAERELERLTRMRTVDIRADVTGGGGIVDRAQAVRGRVAGTVGVLTAGLAGIGLTRAGAEQTAQAVELRRTELETGVSAEQLSRIIEAGGGLTGADFEQALSGLRDTVERLGEVAGDPEAEVLGQFGSAQDEIRRVAAAGGQTTDFLNIALSEIQRRTEQDGRGVGLALARELGGSDESARLLLTLANQQEQFQANLVRVVEQGLSFSTRQLDAAEALAGQSRRTAQNNRDNARDATLNAAAVGARELLGSAGELASGLPNVAFRSESERVEALEREAERQRLERARTESLGAVNSGLGPIEIRARDARADLEIREAQEALERLEGGVSQEVSLAARRAALLTGQPVQPMLDPAAVDELTAQAEDIRQLREQGAVSQQQNEDIKNLLAQIAIHTGGTDRTLKRNDGSTGRID